MAKNGRLIRLLMRATCMSTAMAGLFSLLATSPLYAASIEISAQVTDLVEEDSAFPDPPEVGDMGAVRVGFSETDLMLREAGSGFANFDLYGDWSAGIFTPGGQAEVVGFEDLDQTFSLEVSSGDTDMFQIIGFNEIGETFSLTAIDPLGIAFAGTDLSVVTEVVASLTSSAFNMRSFFVVDAAGAGFQGELLGKNGPPTHPLPEPGSSALLGAGALIVGGLLRKSLRRGANPTS